MAKYLIVTGASSGIGKAIAAAFLTAGWQVLNLSRHACDLAGVNNLLCDFAATGWEIAVTDYLNRWLPAKAQITLVHNAACLVKDTAAHVPAEQFRQVLETSVVAPSILNGLVLPYMQPGSAILYIGSTLSEKAVSGAFSYVTAKHAVAGMMKATCQDLAGSGIHTACICPGFTDTPMLLAHLQHDAKLLEQVKAKVGAQRLITPTEIADCVLFCANHPVINGTLLHANLGQLET